MILQTILLTKMGEKPHISSKSYRKFPYLIQVPKWQIREIGQISRQFWTFAWLEWQYSASSTWHWIVFRYPSPFTPLAPILWVKKGKVSEKNFFRKRENQTRKNEESVWALTCSQSTHYHFRAKVREKLKNRQKLRFLIFLGRILNYFRKWFRDIALDGFLFWFFSFFDWNIIF